MPQFSQSLQPLNPSSVLVCRPAPEHTLQEAHRNHLSMCFPLEIKSHFQTQHASKGDMVRSPHQLIADETFSTSSRVADTTLICSIVCDGPYHSCYARH